MIVEAKVAILIASMSAGIWGALLLYPHLPRKSKPVMLAILTMGPEMSHFQWLLMTLACGVEGYLLCIGSAVGVVLMGASKAAEYLYGPPLVDAGDRPRPICQHRRPLLGERLEPKATP